MTRWIAADFAARRTAGKVWDNCRYGPHPDHRLSVYLNDTRLAAGNSVVFLVHGGAYTGVDNIQIVENWRQTIDLVQELLTDSTFDIISPEYPAWSHANSGGGNYAPTMATGIGRQSMPGYGLGFPDDLQRAVQWAADHATTDPRWTWDPNKFCMWGYSYGGFGSMLASFLPTREYGGNRPYDAQSPVRIRGVLNDSGEVSMSPWVNHYTTTGYLFGLDGATNVKSQIDRLMLIPNSSGLYPSTSARTKLCRMMSPLDVIPASDASKRSIKIMSSYDLWDDTSARDALTVADYAGSPPPYGCNGHDWNQLALLASACSTAGVTHTGATYNSVDGSAANLVAIFLALVPARKAFLEACVA